MVLDEPKKDRDQVYDHDTLKMVIDSDLLSRLGAVTVDYSNSVWRSGFSVTASNDFRSGAAAGSCGSKSGAGCC